jgi:uncharacterized protein GlcG (DUF336 family)
MKKSGRGAGKVLLAGLCASLALPAAIAQETLVTFRSLAPGIALEMAQASLERCRDDGYQVSVAVVDRFGVAQVVLRDRFAGPHTPDTATRLAWTAVSFRGDTLSLADATESPQAGARHIDNVLMIGGGIPVTAAGSIVAGIGISGTPSGDANHACAQAGIDAVAASLELAE